MASSLKSQCGIYTTSPSRGQDVVVRHTFIDICEPAEEGGPGSRIRSSSCGATPTADSPPITLESRPRGKRTNSSPKHDEEVHTCAARVQPPQSAGLPTLLGSNVSTQGCCDFHPQYSQQYLPQQFLQEAVDQQSQSQQPASEAWWLDSAEDVETVLAHVARAAEQLSGSGLVSSLHLIAKLSDANSFGSVQGLQGLLQDIRFVRLVARLRANRQEIDAPRSIMRVMWALGKVGARSQDVDAIIQHVSQVAKPQLHCFSSQELSNVLWAVAKLGDGRRLTESSSKLALAVTTESTRRITGFSAQCLTNSLWAVAKLELRGAVVEAFAQQCILSIHAAMFKEMSPQGLANSLWACAKLLPSINQEVAIRFCLDAARRATASEDLIKLFFPQELSMALWAMARILGRRAGRGGCSKNYPEVEVFASHVADDACSRIHDFTPQGISNIAWSLATLDLVRLPSTARFFEAVVVVAVPQIHSYPPQAIANLCWALSRRDVALELLSAIAPAAAYEAQRRARDFTWQDLSGIVSSLMGTSFKGTKEIQAFATSLVQRASGSCWEIGTQALLNIALSAARLKVDLEVMQPMAQGIAEVFAGSSKALNDIDQRQWNEVRRYCKLTASADSSCTTAAYCTPGLVGSRRSGQRRRDAGGAAKGRGKGGQQASLHL
eukprot:TRINITY_DN35964_c0_g1_i1.p1 TRINITY_DN35964_c0_g1~~TRINITY_DN35964_c0_g1_i1.p1  ORF type:complete len:665 (+),score=124.16 TRINITY_DN35964_c0_g1_i1:90-2084(+)